jgi:hypothetical protein
VANARAAEQSLKRYVVNGESLQRIHFSTSHQSLLSANGRVGRIDACGPRRIRAERYAYPHSGLQIGNARSLAVHSDLGELCDRERPRRALVAYSDRITGHARDSRRVICRNRCRLVFSALTESRSQRDRRNKNPDSEQQPRPHDLRLTEWRRLRQVKLLVPPGDSSL